MIRVILDTNVTISALYPRTVYDLVRTGKIIMLLSSDMEREFIRVLGYSKFGLSAKEIFPLVKNLRGFAELIETRSKLSVISAGPSDNIFLECTVDGKANYIISGDRHLLELSVFNGIPIVRPKEFLLKEKLEP